jgi:hypothetical protein
MTDQPVVRLTSPGEIAAAVPHLCGFVPTESLVAVSLRGTSRRIGLTLRLDLPGDEHREEAAEQVAARLAHDGATAAALVIHTGAPGEAPQAALVDAVIAAVQARDVVVMEALLVRDGLWSSYTCRSSQCCPVDGTPIPDSAAVGVLAATAAFDGRAVLRDRDELVASLAPPVLVAARAAEQRLDAELVSWFADVATRGRADAAADAVLALRTALSACPSDLMPLVVPLQDVGVRDVVATWALDDHEALLSLLLAMARQSVAPYDVPVCTLVALVAWVRGDGAMANVALDRALAGDPAYSMALLFRTGLDGQVPPSVVKEWLRQTRRSRRSRRRGRAA